MPDLEYYLSVFGGDKIPLERLNKYIINAKCVVMHYAPSAPKKLDNDLKLCICAVADELFQQDKIDKNLQSENNDGFSQTFKSKKELDSNVYSIIEFYLSSTGYMYVGFK